MKYVPAGLLGLLLLCGSAMAQNKLQVEPMVPASAAAAPAPAQGGIQGQNIFEVRPDASADPKYAQQSNAQRAQVQPGNNAPMWRQVGAGVSGYSSLPDPEAGNLIQPFVQYPGSSLTNAGEAWRQVRNNWILPYGGSLLLIVLAGTALFYWRKGPIKLHHQPTGRKIERFTAFERSAHWANAIAFLVLAISGVVMAFGKFFLYPLLGGTLFGWLSYVLKNLHNFAGPLFAVSLVVVIVVFLRDNLLSRHDINWLRKGGGLFSEHQVPSHRFNFPEKVVFWAGVFGLGLLLVGSGLIMDKLVPGLSYERSMMQITHMVHSVASVLMVSMFVGHIYLGTIGTEGAYQGMRTGQVDETWAREHHELWYDDVKAGKIPAQSSNPPGVAATPTRAVQT